MSKIRDSPLHRAFPICPIVYGQNMVGRMKAIHGYGIMEKCSKMEHFYKL